MAGAFIKNNNNFNNALAEINNAFPTKGKILNITNGENAYLNVMTKDGKILTDEGQIVENQDSFEYSDLFLTSEKLTGKNIRNFSSYKFVPTLNTLCKKVLLGSDLIIYGPGTQFSSLIPSYLTHNIKKTINKSSALKISLPNLNMDRDLINRSINNLLDLITTNTS